MSKISKETCELISRKSRAACSFLDKRWFSSVFLNHWSVDWQQSTSTYDLILSFNSKLRFLLQATWLHKLNTLSVSLHTTSCSMPRRFIEFYFSSKKTLEVTRSLRTTAHLRQIIVAVHIKSKSMFK